MGDGLCEEITQTEQDKINPSQVKACDGFIFI